MTSDDRPVVLVVDDDPDIAEMISVVLRNSGYRVDTAEDGAAALARVARAPVNLVLLDWRLPGEPVGAQLVRRLRDACGPIPIVVLSADPRSTLEARDARVTDYLPKPFAIDDLVHLVDLLCPAD